jgi:hypothetical protein
MPGKRSLSTRCAAGSISQRRTVRCPAAWRPTSIPPIPAKSPATVSTSVSRRRAARSCLSIAIFSDAMAACGRPTVGTAQCQWCVDEMFQSRHKRGAFPSIRAHQVVVAVHTRAYRADLARRGWSIHIPGEVNLRVPCSVGLRHARIEVAALRGFCLCSFSRRS